MPGRISAEEFKRGGGQLPKGARRATKARRAGPSPAGQGVPLHPLPAEETPGQVWKRCSAGCTEVMNGPEECDFCGRRMVPRSRLRSRSVHHPPAGGDHEQVRGQDHGPGEEVSEGRNP